MQGHEDMGKERRWLKIFLTTIFAPPIGVFLSMAVNPYWGEIYSFQSFTLFYFMFLLFAYPLFLFTGFLFILDAEKQRKYRFAHYLKGGSLFGLYIALFLSWPLIFLFLETSHKEELYKLIIFPIYLFATSVTVSIVSWVIMNKIDFQKKEG